MGAHFSHFGRHAVETLFDQRFQRLAFGFAGDDKVIQRAVQRAQDFSGNSVQILLMSRHYARPAQNIDRIDFAFVALHFDPVGGVNQLLCQFFVEDQLALRARVLLKTQGTFDFTAGQTGTNTFTHHGLQATELLRQAEVGFQISLVYRAQFPRGATPFTLDFTPGVGGHTADHRRSCF